MQYIEESNLFCFTIIGPETDIHDRLHYHSLFAMLQEAACLDAAHYGFGSDKMDELNACWLLLRMKVKMDKIPKWKDKIYIRTWSCGFTKVFFNREFDIFDSDMRSIGWASSVWIIAEQGDHRPVRPQTIEGMEIYASDGTKEGRKVDKIRAFVPDPESDKPLLVKFADYSEIDRNRHVNNTRYIAWSADAFYAEEDDERAITELTVNYSSEVKAGEEILIYRNKKENVVTIDGYEKSGGRHVFSTEIT